MKYFPSNIPNEVVNNLVYKGENGQDLIAENGDLKTSGVYQYQLLTKVEF